jgi:hypothetical protein
MNRARWALAVSLLGSLPACGGGGDGPVTIRLLGDDALDGFVRSDGTPFAVGGGPAIGDVDVALPGLGHRMFFSFPLAAIPPGTTLVSVTLEITTRGVLGTPYATHGNAILDHLDYGPTLDGGDYGLASLAPAFATAATDATLGTKSVDVTARVMADIAAGRPNSQYRLRFSLLDSDNDGVSDVAGWEDAVLSGGSPAGAEPKLIVTYQP